MKRGLSYSAFGIAFCLGLSICASAQGNYKDSGIESIPKLSKEEIIQQLNENPLTLSDDVFEQVPSCASPYSIGKVKTEALQAATNRLNALRQIAGLSPVQLDLDLCEKAQYGAVIIAAQGQLNHRPSKPDDMDNSFYKKAYDATSSSNLSAGRTLTTAVDGFMDDSDANNVDRVGHRRWQLNPQLGRVGFGYAESDSSYRKYVAEKVFDTSGKVGQYDFIAWPSSGNFPSSLFQSDVAWSVSVNPKNYKIPKQSDLTITLTQESNGKTWVFQGDDYIPSNSGSYFNVETQNFGIPNCIIFRPEGIETYQGLYTVEIEGLQTSSGKKVKDFSYQVDFFDPDSKQESEQPSTSNNSFIDVPSSHWAHDAIQKIASLGAVQGVGQGMFAPAHSVSFAEYAAMVSRLFFTGHTGAEQGPHWWSNYAELLLDTGILNQTTAQSSNGNINPQVMESPITRYDMAQTLYNLLKMKKVPLPSSDQLKNIISNIPDYTSIPQTYKEAVAVMYSMELLTGTDAIGTFNGNDVMNRASACTVLTRLLEKI